MTTILLSGAISMIVALIGTWPTIKILRERKLGQQVRTGERAPAHQRKSGTPIMGGIVVIISRILVHHPNLIDDMHDGTIADGDGWLSNNLPAILSSSEYTSGSTAIFITWDEGTGGKTGEDCATNTTDPSCQVATIVISRAPRSAPLRPPCSTTTRCSAPLPGRVNKGRPGKRRLPVTVPVAAHHRRDGRRPSGRAVSAGMCGPGRTTTRC